MPGTAQPPAITPLFLQVVVGKREYSGNIEEDGLSIPVTSLRESMVIMLYNADREFISKSELKTKAVVESGTMDVVFTLDSGGEIILQVKFLLDDGDRKRIQEMRNSAMKRKQQKLRGDGYELNFPDSPLAKRLIEKISNIQSKGDEQPKLQKSEISSDSPLSKRLIENISNIQVKGDELPKLRKSVISSESPLSKRPIEKISNIQSKGDERPKLRKSVSLDDLQERKMFSGISVHPRMKAKRDLLLQRGVGNTLFEDPSGSQKGNSKPESKSSSSVKKMISVVEGTSQHSSVKKMISAVEGASQQGVASEIDASLTDSGNSSTQTGKAIVPFGENKGSSYRSGKTVSFEHNKSSAPGQIGIPSATESRRNGRSSSGDRASKLKLRENDLNRTKRRSQAKHRRSIGPSYSLQRMHSRDYVDCPLNYLVGTSSTWIHPHVCVTTASKQLKHLLELEHWKSPGRMKHTDKIQESTGADELIASAQSRSGSFSMLNGWLINQGVRAAVVVIACGAMLLNNR